MYSTRTLNFCGILLSRLYNYDIKLLRVAIANTHDIMIDDR